MLQQRYFEGMREILAKIEATQQEAVQRCAQVVVDSLLNDGSFHILDTGHMLMYEAVGRSGGLMLVRPIRVSLEVANPGRRRQSATGKKKVYMDEIEGLPGYVIDKSEVIAGDVLLIGSVSGINMLPVGLALAARQRNVTTIALTAVEYSKFLKSAHPSGQRLFEVCDYVLDNCCPVGDTLVDLPELNQGMCPGSGIAAAYLNWALQAEIVELLMQKGKTPHIYVSNHMPGAGQRNMEALAAYEKFGY